MSKVSEHFGVPSRRLTYTGINTKCSLDDTPEGLLGPICQTYKKHIRRFEGVDAFFTGSKRLFENI